MTAPNVLTPYDPGFETTGVTNWLPGFATQLTQSSVQAHGGTKSMSVVCTSGGTTTAIFNTLIPVLPGVIINPSTWAWVATLGQQVQFNLVWYASDKATIISNTLVTGNNPAAGTWTNVSAAGNQAPANAFWVQLQIIILGNIGTTPSYIDDVALAWGNYATNMCPNPGFETDLTGWGGARGTETLTQINNITFTGFQFPLQLPDPTTFTTTLFGNSALQVVTTGRQQNEGVVGPSTWMPVTTTGSMSCNIFGQTGTIVAQAVDQITGAIIGQQTLTLNGSNWVNLQVSNLTFVTGHAYYLQIVTYGPSQSLTFFIDAVMYQPEAPTPYVDGDQYQCFWTGTVEASASYQPYQFGIVATCKFTIGGVANVINTAQVFPVLNTPVLEFFISGGSQQGPFLTVQSPAAAMTDFGIWQPSALGFTDLDPAMAYSTWNNQDVISGQITYNRPYMAVTPSLDQFNSTGGYTWKRSAYMALGWQWISVTNGTSQVLTDVQTELLPINGVNAITPRTYQAARQLQTIVRPDRLNYITNPSFEYGANTSNWSQVGTGQTLSISGDVPTIPGLAFSPGVQSMQVLVPSASGNGVQITIPFLIPGRIYMASMWIKPDGTTMGDVTATCSSGSGTLTASEGTGYSTLPFGNGPYGGVPLPTNPLPNTWQQLFFSFQATADSHVMQVSPLNVGSPVFPYKWLIDAVLVEDGDILNGYFDGNFGVDALWLDGGTANLCQSFYYNQIQFARHIITDALTHNIPLGITYATPQYAVMPTQ